jgi:hypothetical protein
LHIILQSYTPHSTTCIYCFTLAATRPSLPHAKPSISHAIQVFLLFLSLSFSLSSPSSLKFANSKTLAEILKFGFRNSFILKLSKILLGNYLNGESGITMRVSKTLDGEWQSMGIVLGADAKGTWDCDTTNPSPYPLSNGSIVLAYRGCPFNCAGAELINMAFSPSLPSLSPLASSFTRLQPNPIFPNGNEDPFIWQDAKSNWHLLLHSLESGGGFGGPNVGRYRFPIVLILFLSLPLLVRIQVGMPLRDRLLVLGRSGTVH